MGNIWINSGCESTGKDLEMVVITDKAGLVELAPTGDAERGERAGVWVCMRVHIHVLLHSAVVFWL